jgi:Tfp pilus assembly protein PilO
VSRASSLWWQRRRLWLPPAIFLALDLLLLAGYETALAGKMGMQVGAVATRRQELATLRARREGRERLVASARSTRLAVDHLYKEGLGTQAMRLTAVMLEVKRLAHQAGLGGVEAFTYTDEVDKEMPLDRKTIVFSANASYDQLRGFINLLELSPSFLTLEQISVQQEPTGQGQLQLQFRLSTLFYLPPEERPRA